MNEWKTKLKVLSSGIPDKNNNNKNNRVWKKEIFPKRNRVAITDI